MPTTNLTAADVMTPSPRTCSPFSSVVEAVMIFRDVDCGAVPVVDAGEPVGVLTDRDIALAVGRYPDIANLEVSELMSKGVISVGPETSIEELMRQMELNAVKRMIVVDSTGQILGIVALADLARHLNNRAIGEIVSEVLKKS